MQKRVLPLIPAVLVVDQVHRSTDRITIHCRSRPAVAQCPDCREGSSRLHSRYERRIADLPWQGRAVTIKLSVRRLRCGNRRCQHRIFAETDQAAFAPRARRTGRLDDILRCVGLALGGEAGARLIDRLSMPTSADTMLRIVRSNRGPERQTPRVLGVDDWAWRKGQRYGTVLVDLESNDVVDLLPDRETATFAGWLSNHPGVEIITRDRAGAYARGGRDGAPAARQVADRWHLLRNCSDALLNVIERRNRMVREVGKSVTAQLDDEFVGSTPCETATFSRERVSRRQQERRMSRQVRFDQVNALQQRGWSQLAIQREIGTDLKTIRKWLKDGQPGTWQRKAPQPAPAEAFESHLQRRWHEGCRNATQLYREICDQGYVGNTRAFRQWVKIRLRNGMPAAGVPTMTTTPPWRPPSPRQTARILAAEPGSLLRNERAFVDALRAVSPDIAAAAELARRFDAMIKTRDSGALGRWLDDAKAGPLASLARGIRRDFDAVAAALTLPWSTGPVEGKINKIKLIKRSMYGRAGLALLRARVMAT